MLRSFFRFLVSMFLVSMLACTGSDPGPVKIPVGFDWQAHRGGRGLRPENTVASFLHALEYPEVITLELDLAVSKDGILIVSHEPWFNADICRQPDGSTLSGGEDRETSWLIRYTAEEIRQFDCGSWGNPRFPDQQKIRASKPSLQEVVDSVNAHYPGKATAVRWNIEIKSQPEWDGNRTPPVDSFARLVLQTVDKLGITDNTVIQSFDVRALQAVHAQNPAMRTAYLVENMSGVKENIEKLGFIPTIYSPFHQLLGRRSVEACHEQGMQVIPWTVNEVADMRKLIQLGVDGLITDYPDRIQLVSKD